MQKASLQGNILPSKITLKSDKKLYEVTFLRYWTTAQEYLKEGKHTKLDFLSKLVKRAMEPKEIAR